MFNAKKQKHMPDNNQENIIEIIVICALYARSLHVSFFDRTSNTTMIVTLNGNNNRYSNPIWRTNPNTKQN